MTTGQTFHDEELTDPDGNRYRLTQQVLVEHEWIDHSGKKPVVRRYGYVACRRVEVDKFRAGV